MTTAATGEFCSRRMLCLDPRISEAVAKVYERTREGGAAPLTTTAREWSVTRVTMNMYRFVRRDTAAAAAVLDDDDDSRGDRRDDDEYSNTAILQRLISVIMQDAQQRNLNAKHAAAAASSGDGGGGKVSESSYVRLNRSCNQRKIIEVCCSLRGVGDWAIFQREFANPILIRAFNDDDEAAVSPPSSITTTTIIAYGHVDKKALFSGRLLRKFYTLPRLVFVSCKSLILIGSNGTGLPRIVQTGVAAALPLRRHLVYIANFVAYHAFHESDASFDLRRFGARYRYMRTLIYILATVNGELFRVNGCANVNLSLNMQSLGKAYEDAGLHVFSENSIRHVGKIECLANAKRAVASFPTSCHFVNRCLGRVSELGINGVTLTGTAVALSAAATTTKL